MMYFLLSAPLSQMHIANKIFNKDMPHLHAFCAKSHKMRTATVCLLIQRWASKIDMSF